MNQTPIGFSMLNGKIKWKEFWDKTKGNNHSFDDNGNKIEL